MAFSVTAVGYSGAALGAAMALQKHVGANGFTKESFMAHVVESLQGLDLLAGGESARQTGISGASEAKEISAALPFGDSGRGPEGRA